MEEKSTEEWESRIGEQVRALRIAALLSQDELAERANISTGSVRALERGTGSSLKTLVRVSRVLDRTPWLETLDPRGTSMSPIEQLRERRRLSARPQRVPRSRPL
jgi:transcriptional regulator with XRE-family HTH domain